MAGDAIVEGTWYIRKPDTSVTYMTHITGKNGNKTWLMATNASADNVNTAQLFLGGDELNNPSSVGIGFDPNSKDAITDEATLDINGDVYLRPTQGLGVSFENLTSASPAAGTLTGTSEVDAKCRALSLDQQGNVVLVDVCWGE